MWNQENLFSGVKKYSTHQFVASGLGILMWRPILASLSASTAKRALKTFF
jgi:hypothetical protein